MGTAQKNDVLSANELAERLRTDRRTVIKEAKNGKYPSFKMGSVWKFYWPAVERAISGHYQTEDK